jgi:hypothetical protein
VKEKLFNIDKSSAEIKSGMFLLWNNVCFLRALTIRFEKTPVLKTPAGGSEFLQTYLAQHKSSTIKKSDQMCLRNLL